MKEDKVRKFFYEISKINNLGEIVRIEIKDKSGKSRKQHSGLLIKELFHQSEKEVTITLAVSQDNLLEISMLTEDFYNTDVVRIMPWRSLISVEDSHKDNPFIPVDEKGRLTMDPHKIRGIMKANDLDLEREIERLTKEEKNG